MSRYEERFYRDWIERPDLERFEVRLGESDLLVLCDRPLAVPAREALAAARADLEAWIARQPAFRDALAPLEVPAHAPAVARAMADAAGAWAVGPMAAVAGALAEVVGRRLLAEAAGTVIVENGGDVFACAPRPVGFVLYAGEDSPFSDRLAFEVDARRGVGVCTSSGRVGPSLSFGRADAVVAVAGSAAAADAAATAVANRIRSADDVAPVVEAERERGALTALIACAGDRIGCFGDVVLGANPRPRGARPCRTRA